MPLWSTVLSLSTPILAEYYILYLHFMLHTSFCSLSLFFITIITKAVGITRRISIYLSLRRKLGSCSTTLLFGFLQQQKTSPAAFANGEVMLKYVVGQVASRTGISVSNGGRVPRQATERILGGNIADNVIHRLL